MSSSQEAMNPTGGANPRREPTKPALDDDLLERVMAPENLKSAWKQVKANQGAAGVDAMSIESFLPSPRNTGPNSASPSWMAAISPRRFGSS